MDKMEENSSENNQVENENLSYIKPLDNDPGPEYWAEFEEMMKKDKFKI